MRAIFVALALALAAVASASPFNLALNAIASRDGTNSSSAVAPRDLGFTPVAMSQLKEAYERSAGSIVILDVREPKVFGQGYVYTAYSLPVQYVDTHARELPRDRDIYVYCDNGEKSKNVVSFLENRGFTRVFHVVEGYSAWTGPARKIPNYMQYFITRAHELEKYFRQRTIYDVRSREKYMQGHIPGAIHIDMADSREMSRIPFIARIVVIGNAAYDGDEAAKILAKLGQSGFELVQEGMSAWRGPVESSRP